MTPTCRRGRHDEAREVAPLAHADIDDQQQHVIE